MILHLDIQQFGETINVGIIKAPDPHPPVSPAAAQREHDVACNLIPAINAALSAYQKKTGFSIAILNEFR